jgi:hypothetical protein
VLLVVLGVSVDARVTPCVVAAGSNTHTQVRVRDEESGCTRPASLDEMEALMGYPVGLSNARDRVDMTYEQRASAIGNQIHYEQVRAVMAEMDPGDGQRGEDRKASILGVGKPGASTPIERWSEEMSDEELEQWMRGKLEGYELPKLHLRIKGDESVPYQVPVRARYQTPTKLREATLSALRKKLDAGWLKLVPYDPKAWISMMFVKAKGRVDPETLLEAVRFLTDLRAVNAALEWPAHWMDKCPSIEAVRMGVPWWAEWFAEEDVSDAYEGMRLAEHLKNMLCCAPPIPVGPETFTREELGRWLTEEEIDELMGQESWLLRWEGVPQGLAPAAPFWNVHLYDGFNRVFGEEWHEWWTVYVDDMLVFGATEEQTKGRQRLLSMALRLFGKTVSSKIDRTVRQEGHIVGLKFVPGGVVVCDETVAAVKAALEEPVKNAKQARRLVGILIYASSAFEWDADDLTWWPRMMAPLHESYSGHRFDFTEAKQAVRMLAERVGQCRRLPCRPMDMVKDGWRLVIKSDGSDVGVGACMMLVKCEEGGEVTPEMMLDPEKVRLVATYCKVLSEGEKKWLTFEIEAYGMYKALRKWGGFLMQAGVGGWSSHPPLLWMDSSTATAQWTGVGIPAAIDHASAKALRFLGWAEKIEYVRWMGLDMRWIPGQANDFADLLSRCADLIKRSAAEMAETPRLFPMMRMKYHRDSAVGEQGEGNHGAPEGYEAVHLGLSPEEWREVERAYLADDDKVQGVAMSDLFRGVVMEGEGVSAETMIRIRPWIGRRYFRILPPGGGGTAMLYVPRAQTRTHWAEEDDTRVLVVMVPAGASVVMTELREVRSPEDQEEFEVTDLRRSLLMVCHDLNQHPGIGETVTAVKKMAYWPTMLEGRDSCRRHWEMCAHCIEQMQVVQPGGRGSETSARFRVLQADHKVLTDREAGECGCPAVLSLVDVATRVTVYVPAGSQTACETAALILMYWVPFYGVPVLLITDPHPGFASEVMAAIRRTMGIKDHEMGAARQKGRVAVVERSHRVLGQVLEDGFAKGDIGSVDDLRMYCGFAMVKRNQVVVPGGVSAFELVTGQKARLMQSLALVEGGDEDAQCLADQEGAAALVKRVNGMTAGLLEYELQVRDQVARKNAMRNDKSLQQTSGMALDLAVGDAVSHAGQRWIVEELRGEPGAPVTVGIARDGESRRVRVSEVKPMAAALPVRMLPKQVRVDDFVMWVDAQGYVTGGTVVDVDGPDGNLVVHARQADAGAGKSWVPLWFRGEDREIVRSKRCPPGGSAELVEVLPMEIRVVGQLTGTHRMEGATAERAMAQDLMG